MGRYAANTDVSSDRSRQEIERTLVRYGASQFIYGWDQGRAVVGFSMSNRTVRFELAMPDPGSDEFQLTETGRQRSASSVEQAYEQAVRQRWRALALVVKAKLEAVESGISTFEEEFLAHIVLPSGETFGDWAAPQIERAYREKKMPPLLGSGS